MSLSEKQYVNGQCPSRSSKSCFNSKDSCIRIFFFFCIKIQQVNSRDPPGKVAVTCRELQYHSNSHKNNSKNLVRLSPTHSTSKKFTCCIYKSNLVVIGFQLFTKLIEILHFPSNLTSDDPWPWYITFDFINIQREPPPLHLWPKFGSNRTSNFSKQTQITKTNIFHLTWPQMTFDLSTWPSSQGHKNDSFLFTEKKRFDLNLRDKVLQSLTKNSGKTYIIPLLCLIV